MGDNEGDSQPDGRKKTRSCMCLEKLEIKLEKLEMVEEKVKKSGRKEREESLLGG